MSQPSPVETLSPREQRRNYLLGVANGALYSMGEVFIDPEMVLTWFLTQLNAANFWIGMIAPVRYGSWFLPQLFVSGYMQRQPRKQFFYHWMSVVRGVVLLALVLMALLLPVKWMLPAFFVLLALYSLGAGLCGIAFMDVVGKVIPPTRRGSFFGMRMFLGGILAFLASSLVGFILDEPDGLRFPLNFGVLYGVAFLLIILSLIAWSLVKEPSGPVDPARVRWTTQVRRGMALLEHDRAYRSFVLTRLALMLAQLAGPFYLVYAKEAMGISARMVGLYLTARTATSIAFNLIWGRVSDRQGNRLLIRITTAIGLAMPLLALLLGGLVTAHSGLAPAFSYLYIAVFVASGAFSAGSGIGNMNYLLDIAPPEQRSLYLGFTNTLFGIAFFASGLGGLIVDLAGFTVLMLLAVLFYGAALAFSLRMAEPRAVDKEKAA